MTRKQFNFLDLYIITLDIPPYRIKHLQGFQRDFSIPISALDACHKNHLIKRLINIAGEEIIKTIEFFFGYFQNSSYFALCALDIQCDYLVFLAFRHTYYRQDLFIIMGESRFEYHYIIEFPACFQRYIIEKYCIVCVYHEDIGYYFKLFTKKFSLLRFTICFLA